MRDGRFPHPFDGGTDHLFSFVHQRFDRTQKIQRVAFLVDPPSVWIEIVIDVDDVSRREDSSTLSSQVDPVTPAIVGLQLDVNRISDVDVDLVRVSAGEFVQTAVCGFDVG